MNFKTAPQLHFSVNPLGKDRPDTEHPADLGANHDTADSGGYHKFHVSIFEVLRDLTAKEMQVFRVLQDLGALKVLRAVQPGRELKVAFEESFRFAKNVENLFFWEFHGACVIVVDGCRFSWIIKKDSKKSLDVQREEVDDEGGSVHHASSESSASCISL